MHTGSSVILLKLLSYYPTFTHTVFTFRNLMALWSCTIHTVVAENVLFCRNYVFFNSNIKFYDASWSCGNSEVGAEFSDSCRTLEGSTCSQCELQLLDRWGYYDTLAAAQFRPQWTCFEIRICSIDRFLHAAARADYSRRFASHQRRAHWRETACCPRSCWCHRRPPPRLGLHPAGGRKTKRTNKQTEQKWVSCCSSNSR